MHLSIFISVINQLDAQNFCFTISLFHVSTCFEYMFSKHVEVWNKLIVKQIFCASSWLITEINIQILSIILPYSEVTYYFLSTEFSILSFSCVLIIDVSTTWSIENNYFWNVKKQLSLFILLKLDIICSNMATIFRKYPFRIGTQHFRYPVFFSIAITFKLCLLLCELIFHVRRKFMTFFIHIRLCEK